MKILIGYNGSNIAEAALADLQHAGLPEKAEVLVLTVAEVWLPPKNTDEAEILAWRAENLLRKKFPLWDIKTEISFGSPAREILTKAEEFKADLVVVGENCHSPGGGSMFLHGTSHKILSEAKCSVRISRGRIENEALPTRVVVGYDGSHGARVAIEEVAARHWGQKTEVHLIVVADSAASSSIGRFVAPVSNSFGEMKIVREQMEKLAELPLQKLKNAGLDAVLSVGEGNPKGVVTEMAEEWQADVIFVGPNHLGTSFERCLLGSVSESIASRAHCSVEVVRTGS